MSETWTSLLAALVGAIVGGAASLAGTMLVNKQQMATNARMRMFDELLPRLERILDPLYKSYGKDYLRAVLEVEEVISAVGRASAIAGRKERAAYRRLMNLWLSFSFEGRLKRVAEKIRANPASRARVREVYNSLGVESFLEERQNSEDFESLQETWYQPHNPEWDYKRRDDVTKLRDEVAAFSGYLGAKLG